MVACAPNVNFVLQVEQLANYVYSSKNSVTVVHTDSDRRVVVTANPLVAYCQLRAITPDRHMPVFTLQEEQHTDHCSRSGRSGGSSLPESGEGLGLIRPHVCHTTQFKAGFSASWQR